MSKKQNNPGEPRPGEFRIPRVPGQTEKQHAFLVKAMRDSAERHAQAMAEPVQKKETPVPKDTPTPDPRLSTPDSRPPYPEIMTIDQAAEYLQIHRQVLYRHVRSGTVPAARIGGTIRFKKSVLDAFIEQNAWDAVRDFMAFQKRQRSAGKSPPKSASSETEPPPRQRRFSADID